MDCRSKVRSFLGKKTSQLTRFWRPVRRISLKAILVAAGLLLAGRQVPAQTALWVITDRPSYNVGADVRIRLVEERPSAGPAGGSEPASREIVASIRYAGEGQPTLATFPVPARLLPSESHRSPEYFTLWKVPLDARTGRYEIGLTESDPKMHRVLRGVPKAASFMVYRKLVRIEEIKLDKTFFTAGDPVAVSVKLKNLTHGPLSGLRVEFSDRYWPWIAGPAEQARASVVELSSGLTLPADGEESLRSEKVGVAKDVNQPSTHQFAVVVWDPGRKNVLDIAFSQLSFVHGPRADSPKPYPGQYTYSDLGSVNATSYRHFYPPQLESGAIEFGRGHTMFASGGSGQVSFAIVNPTPNAWRGVALRARLLSPDGAEVASKVVAESLDVDAGKSTPKQEVEFNWPAGPGGLYRAEVEVQDASGRTLATNTLELGVNPLPKSILIFCAHEDDEGGYAGLARAAVENHIPIHFVYFTSGDAGSCDRYYEHSCSPAEAFDFGGLRMDEVRASLGHLGVPREAIYFLGLPDGGSGQIWYSHRPASNPFLDPLLATDHAPYDGLVHPNLPYARDSIVDAVKELIRKFQPEVVGTAHPPSVGHIDHIVNNYFVVKALQEMLAEGAVSPDLTLLVDRAYDPKQQPKTPYQYRDVFLHVSGEVAALAQEAGWFHQSQGGTRGQGNVQPFAQLPRTETFRQVLDWKDHAGWNEGIESPGH